MPVPQESLFVVEQASFLFLVPQVEFICCGTGIFPVANNGAISQIKSVANNYLASE